MNTLLRSLIVWLLLLAMPYRGMAAADMVACAPAHGMPAHAKQAAMQVRQPLQDAQHPPCHEAAPVTRAADQEPEAAQDGAAKCGTCSACGIGTAVLPVGLPQLAVHAPASASVPALPAACRRSTSPSRNDLRAPASLDPRLPRPARGLSNAFLEDVMTFVTTLSRVAALCLLAGVAHAAPAAVSAADGSIPVPATVYSPALSYGAPAPQPASPDRAWREQNRIVAGYDGMMLTGPQTGDAQALRRSGLRARRHGITGRRRNPDQIVDEGSAQVLADRAVSAVGGARPDDRSTSPALH
ncbi:hypothetical protein ACHAC9_17860 [Massilia sp. CMS3.1]|uniref:hypothetical protein n=1 Tax=Massilia sp. CMS3.1 TaxID=3373083 RepID=UPI003EE57424